MKIICVCGARPQFVKAAAVSRAIVKYNTENPNCIIDEKIVHTGQHYDENMSKVFFDELKIPRPYVNLEVGSGLHGRQTGLMLEKVEEVLLELKPDIVLVYGDTNSTLAGALAAAKLHIPIAHVEAGLRSFNRKMPEEINRLVADHLSSILFCPTDTAVENLQKEGITDGVHQVGDVMYDSVLFNVNLAEQSSQIMSRLELPSKGYYVATIHRAENTNDTKRMDDILSAFGQIDFPVVLPMHPRTRKILGKKLTNISKNVRVIDPVAYFDMLMLEKNSRLILTDSGGIQKEAYWFSVPCVTLRDETEWVETVEAGCNILAGAERQRIVDAVKQNENKSTAYNSMLYGDGHSAERICRILLESQVNQI
ncbi:MAG: UDP-N-acetylglucosamine 2-epimerase (non-hydrolyzing) [Phycisphaerae bacterium]|nr:UDP-N-acetylglucosamine 2-epimerase (non-hydrolyzing) [Phycisphaerae bacterium]MDD5380281.1 UDP-N-acetylglucosamine 2-epimerase (non-hydrolyzing) [Phycisphaerae bacterium]